MLDEKRVIEIGDKQIVLDPENMKFNEVTLSNFLETEAAYYDYFGWALADAEYVMQRLESHHDVMFAERFKEWKDQGKSDKMAEQSARADEDVEKANLAFIASKHKVRLLQQHLRSWDRAHENAQSRGHFLRKEMDKLRVDIMMEQSDLERRVNEIVKSN
jgi:hypothetical protein